MARKEFKVGEVFQYGTAKLKCVKTDLKCQGCLFSQYNCPPVERFLGECQAEDRDDNTDVIFVEVEE